MPPPDLSSLERAILEFSSEGVYALDTLGALIFANPAAARLTGWEFKDLADRTRASGQAAPWRNCTILVDCQTGQIPRKKEGLFWRKNGTSFPVEYSATPLRDNDILIGCLVIFHDITELHNSNIKLNAILEAADSVAVMTIGPDGKVNLFNRGAERMLGYESGEIVNKQTPFLFLLPAEVDERQRELSEQFGVGIARQNVLFELAARGIAEAVEWTYVRKDGELLRVSSSVTAMRDESGVIIGYIAFAFDLTKLAQERKALQEAKQTAEAANLAKNEFLATLSHEIRTPMNGILGMASLLLRGELTPRQHKRTETLRDSAEALLAMLNGVLDLAKIQARKLELEVVAFDLRSLIESVIDLVAVKAQEKGLELVCSIDPRAPVHRFGDANRLRQVLLNLLGNAVKFTAEGEVVLRVSQASEDDSSLLRFEVKDTGIGIEPAKHGILYERFSQADSSTARQYGGTGLGLSIVHGLVKMMGGRTGFVSEPGRGSSFWFTASLTPQAVANPRAPGMSGKRILVVDDNAASRAMLLDSLTFWQCEVEQAGSASAAMKRLKNETLPQFDAVVVDLEMQDYRGDRLEELVHEDPKLAAVPMILMTPAAYQTPPGRSGFAGRLGKPVKQEALATMLAALIGDGPEPSIGQRTFQTADDPQRRFERQPRSNYRLLVVEDSPVNQEVALGLLEQLGYSADVVSDARSALQALRTTAYSLILTDCQLPETDGYELVRLIREPLTRLPNPRIPVIAMTANALVGDREKCLAAGMNDYISKPINPATLETVLERWTVGHAPSPPNDRFDGSDLVERMLGNQVLARRVVGSYIDDMGSQLTALAHALNRGDASAVRLTAHSIRGAAANVGDQPLLDIASELEQLGAAGDLLAAIQVAPRLASTFETRKPLLQSYCDN